MGFYTRIQGEAQRMIRLVEDIIRLSHKELGGTGLGLSIVKHAARLYNAKIQLSSTEGKGTAITVIFPKSSK